MHWQRAIVIDKRGRSGEAIRVGLADGRIVPLNAWNAAARQKLQVSDVVYVRLIEAKGKAAKADLRIRPQVQGSVVVLENKSGRILAMAGGFSYPLSQLNRVTQSSRQPGSTLKPLTYLAALKSGLQPNTLVADTPLTLPPIGAGMYSREEDYWTPKNFDGGGGGAMTLRRGLENSRNLVTAHLLEGGIDRDPEQSLDQVCALAVEAQLYKECVRHYPFVLGAQPVRLVDLAAFYAAIANEGARPTPYAIDAIEQDGRAVYKHDENSVVWLGSADRAAFFQLKSMLQGVVARGTAAQIRTLAPYVAGKTGTSDEENDAWFVGFTNEITIAVWVGYDNGEGKRRTLGNGQTGAKVALPIFEPIMQAAWAEYAPRTALKGPSSEAQRSLIAVSIDLVSGDRLPASAGRGFTEYFRRDRYGQIDDTQHKLISQEEMYAYRDPGYGGEGDLYGYPRGPGSSGWQPYGQSPYGQSPYGRGPQYGDPRYGQYYGQQPQRQPPPRADNSFWRGLFGGRAPWEDDDRPRPRRVDPDYMWGQRR